MKKIIIPMMLLGVFFLAVDLLAQPCASPANIYTFSFNGKNYEIVKEMKTWEDAADCAVERGGYLAQIGSVAEQAAIFDAILNGAMVSPTYTTSPDGGGIAYVWIGATDKETEGTWLWDGNDNNAGVNFWQGQGNAGAGGGSAVGGNYINWGGTSTGTMMEPDDWSEQDAAGIGLTGWPSGTTMLGIPGEWNDIDVTNLMYFVIEHDSASSVKENEGHSFLIYPNPADDAIYISSAQSQPLTEVSFFNQTGRLIRKEKPHTSNLYRLDVEDLEAGMYLLKLSSSGSNPWYERVVVR